MPHTMTDEEFYTWRRSMRGVIDMTLGQINLDSTIKNNKMSQPFNASQKIKDWKAITEKNDGKTYFDLVQQRFKDDPGAFQGRMAVAEKMAKSDTDKFLAAARDFNAEGHEKAYDQYKNQFNSDKNQAYNSFLAIAMRMCDAQKLDARNLSYERDMINSRVIKDKTGTVIRTSLGAQSNLDDSAAISKYRAFLQSKWDAIGYDGDDHEIYDFWQNHSLSSDSQYK